MVEITNKIIEPITNTVINTSYLKAIQDTMNINDIQHKDIKPQMDSLLSACGSKRRKSKKTKRRRKSKKTKRRKSKKTKRRKSKRRKFSKKR